MISYLLQSMLILTLFYIVFKFVFEKKTFFHHNRYFLLAGIILTFIIPLLPLNFSQVEFQYVYGNPNWINNSQTSTQSENLNYFTEILNELTLVKTLTFIYLLGLTLGISKFIIQIFRLTQIFQQGEKLQKDGIQFIFTNHEISPFSFFNKIIINPNHYTNEQLNHIITHESIHVQQAHQIDVFLAEWTKIILWFFPLSWWYSKSVKNNLEFIADHDSIQNGIDKKAYQLNLIKISQQPSGSDLVNSFSKKLIKSRIKMLNKMKTNKKFIAYYAILVPAMIFASIGLSAQIQSQEKKIEKIVIVKDKNGDDQSVVIKFDNSESSTSDKEKKQKKSKKKDKDQEVSKIELNLNELVNDPEFIVTNSDVKIIKSNENTNEYTIVKDGETKKILVLNSYPYSKVDVKKDVVEIGYGEEYIPQEGDIFLSPEELKNKIENGEIDVNKKGNEWMKKIELKDNKIQVFSTSGTVEPKIKIDGKDATSSDLENLKPEQIAEMHVSKSDNGGGTIEIKTK